MGTIFLRRFDITPVGFPNAGISQVSHWYKIPIIDDLSISFNSPVSPMPLPQEDDEKQILIKMEGNSADINISWLIKNEKNNMAAANSPMWNYGESIKTVWEQLSFLQQRFIPVGIKDSFEVCIDPYDTVTNLLSDTASFAFSKKGTITKLDFRITSSEPAVVRVSLVFLVGEVISAYGLNVPSAPKNFTAISSQANTINASWSAPSTTGGGTIRYVLSYKKTNSASWLNTETVNANLTSTNIALNLGAGNGSAYYDVYVTAYNTNGKGQKTNSVTLYVQ